MGILKRVVLFFALNMLVVLTISVILSVLNVKPYLTQHGLDFTSLMIFCLIWGMGGAFISLGLSRMMAKWLMGVHIIDPETNNPEQRRLLQTVYRLSEAANLPKMPEVGMYDSPELNAFATGPSRRRSLVAVSSGLLNRMSQEELDGVIGHEVAHIANGDMVTMTLLQGVVNAFVMFLARILAYAASGLGQSRSRSSQGSLMSFRIFTFIFEIIFMALGMMVIAVYSRFREFRADRGGAQLAGKHQMISALEALKKTATIHDTAHEKPAFQTMKISHRPRTGFLSLFATHPPLDERIERLRQDNCM